MRLGPLTGDAAKDAYKRLVHVGIAPRLALLLAGPYTDAQLVKAGLRSHQAQAIAFGDLSIRSLVREGKFTRRQAEVIADALA